jgi:hypothetical protein
MNVSRGNRRANMCSHLTSCMYLRCVCGCDNCTSYELLCLCNVCIARTGRIQPVNCAHSACTCSNFALDIHTRYMHMITMGHTHVYTLLSTLTPQTADQLHHRAAIYSTRRTYSRRPTKVVITKVNTHTCPYAVHPSLHNGRDKTHVISLTTARPMSAG